MRLVALLLLTSTSLVLAEVPDWILFHSGKLEHTAFPESSFPGSHDLRTLDDGFVIFRLNSNALVKAGSDSVLKLRHSPNLGIQFLTLLDGSLFLNLPSTEGQEHIVETPYGNFSSRRGDFLFLMDLQKEVLEISCGDGLGVFKLDHLEYSLAPGEKLYFYQGRIYPKKVLAGSENRVLYSWYQRSHAWPLPAYFNSLSAGIEDQLPAIEELYIMGLPVSQSGYQDRVFGIGDLILGMIRIEGRLVHHLPHQTLQISLNAGAEWEDLGSRGEFLFKIPPKESQYEVQFRLRENHRVIPLSHPPVSFRFHADFGEGVVKSWLENYKRLWERADAVGLRRLLQTNRSYSLSIYEDLLQILSSTSTRRIQFEILNLIKRAGMLMTEVRFTRVTTQKNSLLPIRQSGVWQLVIKEDSQGNHVLIASSGEDPVFGGNPVRAGDRTGPKIFASQRVNVDPAIGATLAITAEDDASRIVRVEYYTGSVGTAGTGFVLACDDGVCDERRETATLRIRPKPGVRRVFVRALDGAGNWGPVHSVLLE